MLEVISLGLGIGFSLHLLFSLFGYTIYSLFQIFKSG